MTILQLLTTLPGRESCMLNADCHFCVPEHGCSIEGSVSNFFARVGRDAYSLGVAFSTVSLELPDGVSIYHAGTYYDLQFRPLQEHRLAESRECHLPAVPRLILSEISFHSIFRACYRHQIDADIISVLVKRHCRYGRQSERSRSGCLPNFFFHEYGRRVGMVPRSSLKEGKNSQMVEKRTRTTKTTQTKQTAAHRPSLHHLVVFPLC